MERNNIAVAYIRMSTDHQEFSPDIQRRFIQKYALEQGLQLIREYTDEGKSGLSAEKRPQFLSLIHLVQSGNADFTHILVYDISRWGRFINIDESAHYEQICAHMGITVHYCAEPFKGNDIGSQIFKTVKRWAAGEYSRELGEKVFNGQKNLIERGFRQGGPAGFGLRRQLISADGTKKFELKQGDRKSLQTDRVVLIAGPKSEQRIILKIYHEFIYGHKTEQQIAENLNKQGILTDRNTHWTKGVVHQILINEKYIGHNVWNKNCSSKTGRVRGKNPKSEWIRFENAFEAIIPQALFNAAQTIIHQRSNKLTDDEMLAHLRILLKMKGKLSGLIIDESDECPSSSAYSHRFGSLIQTYKLINYDPGRDYHYIEINRLLRRQHKNIVLQVIDKISTLKGHITVKENDLLEVNEEFTASLVLSPCRPTVSGNKRWLIRLDTGLNPDLTIAVRLDQEAEQIIDYYLLPMKGMTHNKLKLAESNPAEFDIYHYKNLDRFFSMAERILLGDFYEYTNYSNKSNSYHQSKNS